MSAAEEEEKDSAAPKSNAKSKAKPKSKSKPKAKAKATAKGKARRRKRSTSSLIRRTRVRSDLVVCLRSYGSCAIVCSNVLLYVCSVPRPSGEAAKLEATYMNIRHGKSRSSDGPPPACPFTIPQENRTDDNCLNAYCGHSCTEWRVSPSHVSVVGFAVRLFDPLAALAHVFERDRLCVSSLQAVKVGKKAQLQCRCAEIRCPNCPVCKGEPILPDDFDTDGVDELEKQSRCICHICVCQCSKASAARCSVVARLSSHSCCCLSDRVYR